MKEQETKKQELQETKKQEVKEQDVSKQGKERRTFLKTVGAAGAGVIAGSSLGPKEASAVQPCPKGRFNNQTFSENSPKRDGVETKNQFMINVEGFELDPKLLSNISKELVRNAVDLVRELGRPTPGNRTADFSTFSTFSTFSSFGSG